MHDNFLCQQIILTSNFFPFTLEKSAGSPAHFFSALHRHMQSDILPQWCGQSPTAVSLWLPQFWVPPQGSLLLTNSFFSLSKLPFVAILALHRQHKKPLADFSSPSCRGTCNWQQLTSVWSMLYSYSCNCKYHPAAYRAVLTSSLSLGLLGFAFCGQSRSRRWD